MNRKTNFIYPVWAVFLVCLVCNVTDAQTSKLASAEKLHTDKSQTDADTSKQQDSKDQILSILSAQVDAWNEGDLKKFMQTYWKSDKLTFSSSGKTTHGWQPTLDNYKKSYSPPKEMGKLHFDELKIMMIESKSALVLGNWHLKMKDDTKLDGNFSLVVKQFDDGWKIIHDHSSTLKKDDEEGESKDEEKK